MARAPRYQMLVDHEWLVTRIGTPELRIIDCTVRRVPVPDGPSVWQCGRDDWRRGHIPGAGYVAMHTDLSDPDGQFPLAAPSPEAVGAVLSRLGIDGRAIVVTYGAGSVSAVHRVWWLLMMAGARDVRVLDGGWQRWTREGHPVASGRESAMPAEFRGEPRRHWLAGKSDVIESLGDPRTRLVHSLTEQQFRGTGGQVYGRPGRIPGSVNVPVSSLVDPATGRFRPPDQLRKAFAPAEVDDCDRIITYCGGGIAASTTFLALTLLGYDNVRLYDGSLLEWAAEADLPMETG